MNARRTKKSGWEYWLKHKNSKEWIKEKCFVLKCSFVSLSQCFFLGYAQIKSWWLNHQPLICRHLVNGITPTYISESVCKYGWWDKSNSNLKSPGRIQSFPGGHWALTNILFLPSLTLLIDTLIHCPSTRVQKTRGHAKNWIKRQAQGNKKCPAQIGFYLTG